MHDLEDYKNFTELSAGTTNIHPPHPARGVLLLSREQVSQAAHSRTGIQTYQICVLHPPL